MRPDNGYTALALELRELAPDLVESYLDARPSTRSAAQLGDTAAALREQASGDAWLTAQLAAIETACEVLAGERLPYGELVVRCYGVEAPVEPEATFAAAHERLDAALPGTGPPRERYAAWLATQQVPREQVLPALTTLAAALRERTRATFGLPAGERIELELVSGEPWFAFAEYRGDLRSRIEVNTDLPLHAFDLLDLMTHEAYPGHHTEQVHKHAFPDAELFVHCTPQALVAEGLAQVAREQLLGPEGDRIAAELLRPLGISYDTNTAAEVRAVYEDLGRVRPNLARFLDDGMGLDDARAYARTWMVESDAHVDKTMRALVEAPWPPYESCYPEGLRLCRAFLAREPHGFERLLSERLTTSDLV